MNRRIAKVICFMATSLALNVHAAECENPKTSKEVAQCLGKELRESDVKINQSYKELMGKLGDGEKATLRQEQRAWIKERDAVCGLDTKESNREKWYQMLLTDYRRTVCVTRYTRQRTAELDRMLDKAKPQPQGKPESAEEPKKTTVSHPQEDYQVFFRYTPEKGRWYFEITLNVGAIAKFSPTALWLGCVDEKTRTSFGGAFNIRDSDTSHPAARLGGALDLETGKLYLRQQGEWLRGAPGSADALDLKLGRPYRCGASTSALIGPLIEKEFLQINFGGKPFTYSIPDGYRPLSENGN